MNTLTIHKTTHASTSYGWLEYGLEYRIGNAEIHRIFSSSLIHCALDYKTNLSEKLYFLRMRRLQVYNFGLDLAIIYTSSLIITSSFV